jgi:hypothetical protein
MGGMTSWAEMTKNPLLDRIARWMKRRGVSPVRFFISMTLASVLIIASLFLFFWDSEMVGDDPIQRWIAILIMIFDWPIVLAALVGGDRLAIYGVIPFSLFSAFAWACAIEGVIRLAARFGGAPGPKTGR